MTRPVRVRLAALAGGVMALTLAAAPARAAAAQAWAQAQAVPSHAQAAAAQAGLSRAGGSTVPSQPSVAITSVTPNIAVPKSTVRVSGVVTNPSAAPLSGLTVQLWSSSLPLNSTAQMSGYLAAPPPTGLDYMVGSPWSSALPLGPHASRDFSVTLPVSDVGMTSFGVYPLAAQLSGDAGPLAEARTFLPFWPGNSAERGLRPVSVAWVWPLIGTPARAACGALLSGSLATSVARSGRLGQLLAAGQTPAAAQADLTWAIDPGLLTDVSVMTSPYRVGANATCSGGRARPASPGARAWLAGVRKVAATRDYFVTPYHDVDVAALAHRGLSGELASAFTQARAEAKRVLGGAQRPGPTAAAGGSGPGGGTGWIAWPPGGIADITVLAALATSPNRIGTVILDSGMMPPSAPVPYTPSAITSTPNGLGSQMHVLLTDNTITHILRGPVTTVPGLVSDIGTGTAAALAAPPAAGAFARAQWFLAETAMISYQDPSLARAMVVAPPRRWDPGASLASALLTDTVAAPWLRPTSLAGLVSAGPATGRVTREQPRQKYVSPDELKLSLLRQVRHLVQLTQVQGAILVPPQPQYLSRAVAATESSAWRGGRAGRLQAEALLRRIRSYVTAQLLQVRVVRTLRITLGGKSGVVPVSISNDLRNKVRVRLDVSHPADDGVTIGRFQDVVTVAGGTQKIIKIPVQAAHAGLTTLSLRLSTPEGRLLPGKPVLLTVEATHFGTLALVIIGIAMLVFVLTVGGRAIRRGGGRVRPGAVTGDDEDVTEADPACAPGEPDTVEPGRADGAHATKEPDDQASTPGQAGQVGRAGRR